MSESHLGIQALPIPGSSLQSVQYATGRMLDASDFEAEQDYHLAARRRHLLGAHDWGIVEGLELEIVAGEDPTDRVVTLQPGFAVDGLGREIVIDAEQPVESSWIDRVGWDIDAVEICLEYQRVAIEFGDERHQHAGRWNEIPRLVFRAADGPTQTDEGQLAHRAVGDRSREPSWPVSLGVLRAAKGDRRKLVYDGGVRRLASFVADEVRATDDTVRLSMGAGTMELSTRTDAQSDWSTRLEVGPVGAFERRKTRRSGEIWWQGPSRSSRSPRSLPLASEDPRIYRIADQLRIDMPSGGEFQLGCRSAEGDFVPVLTVKDGVVHVKGDLTATGLIDSRKTPLVPEDEAGGAKKKKERSGGGFARAIAAVLQSLGIAALAIAAWEKWLQ